jgi:hypothetical protein
MWTISGTALSSFSAWLANSEDSARVAPGLRRMSTISVPSLNGGRKVFGKNGTETAATATASPPAAKAAQGWARTACKLRR